MICIGIDPGTATTGYGVVKEDNGSFICIDLGVIKTSKDLSTSKRLLILNKTLDKLIKQHSPDFLAVENLYFFKNIKTALPVSQAKGVILLTAEKRKLPIYEFTPLEIKQSIVGYGRAEKNQVKEMIKIILNLKEKTKYADTSDALGVAVCGLLKEKSLLS